MAAFTYGAKSQERLTVACDLVRYYQTVGRDTAFFESPDQLGIAHETMVQIQREGIQAVADLADFEKQELHQLADNLRKPGGRIPDPNPNAAPGATIPMPAFTYGAKSQKRLTVACDLVRYYQTVERTYFSKHPVESSHEQF